MNKNKIITHTGTAHKDEFLACSLVLSHLSSKDIECDSIERRVPTMEDLNDPSVWCIDVGSELNHERHNFDHHQDFNLPCSMVLIARYLNIEADLSEMYDWWDLYNTLDTRGPKAVKEKFKLINSMK